jgi:hypothetical protein
MLMAVIITGCTTPLSPAPNPLPYASVNAAVNTSIIPLLLTDDDWKRAGDCGWTADNLSETAAIFQDNCQVRRLLGDGWEIGGIGYDMNLIGSRCRLSTHPDAPGSCDWCLDAGPTLTLSYKGIMTTEFLANVQEKTTTRFMTEMPEEAGSVATADSDRVVFGNGTVLYTFTSC